VFAGWLFKPACKSSYWIWLMKTWLNLPDRLIKEAMQLTDAKTKVVDLPLKELIRKNRVAGLKAYKGKIDLDIDIDTLRNRNARIHRRPTSFARRKAEASHPELPN
jgi:hypothetical protein